MILYTDYVQSYSFFYSTRGVKQEHPLSLALFVLSGEVLSKSLSTLFEDDQYVRYGMSKWRAQINHLDNADDTFIFSYANNILSRK